MILILAGSNIFGQPKRQVYKAVILNKTISKKYTKLKVPWILDSFTSAEVVFGFQVHYFFN